MLLKPKVYDFRTVLSNIQNVINFQRYIVLVLSGHRARSPVAGTGHPGFWQRRLGYLRRRCCAFGFQFMFSTRRNMFLALQILLFKALYDRASVTYDRSVNICIV
jgi:hypothetical protein